MRRDGELRAGLTGINAARAPTGELRHVVRALVQRELPQHLLQQLPGAVQAGHHRTDGTTHHVGDLLVGHAFDGDQHQDFTLFGAEFTTPGGVTFQYDRKMEQYVMWGGMQLVEKAVEMVQMLWRWQ